MTDVVIVGAGLAGLYAARLLRKAGVGFVLIEARERLGGRIFTADEAGLPSDDGYGLGPSWFWPSMQPAIGELIEELGLASFGQNTEGDVLFERMSRERLHRWRRRLVLAGSETSPSEPGYLAGAIIAAKQAVGEILRGRP